MDWSIPAAAFVAFICGISIVSKVAAWAAAVHFALRSSKSSPQPVAQALAPLVMHSGPWLLVAVVMVLYYVAHRSRPAMLWAIIAGLAVAIAFVTSFAIYAHWRSKHPLIPSAPLTSERLALIHRRFFWLGTVGFGGISAASLLYFQWPLYSQSLILVGIVVAASLCGGWIYSWFMWQWYGASVEAREKARLKREGQNAV
jgi:hypothetical protein